MDNSKLKNYNLNSSRIAQKKNFNYKYKKSFPAYTQNIKPNLTEKYRLSNLYDDILPEVNKNEQDTFNLNKIIRLKKREITSFSAPKRPYRNASSPIKENNLTNKTLKYINSPKSTFNKIEKPNGNFMVVSDKYKYNMKKSNIYPIIRRKNFDIEKDRLRLYNSYNIKYNINDNDINHYYSKKKT